MGAATTREWCTLQIPSPLIPGSNNTHPTLRRGRARPRWIAKLLVILSKLFWELVRPFMEEQLLWHMQSTRTTFEYGFPWRLLKRHTAIGKVNGRMRCISVVD